MARIYLSSTYSDLKDHREHVYRALRKLGHDVRAMEDYVASDTRPLRKCLDDVARSDLYVGLIGWQYGFIPEEDNTDGKSITELEYREALARGIPTLLFLQKEDARWLQTSIHARAPSSRIEAFRAEVKKVKTVGFFDSIEGVATDVSVAVTNQLADTARRQGAAAWLQRHLDGIDQLCMANCKMLSDFALRQGWRPWQSLPSMLGLAEDHC